MSPLQAEVVEDAAVLAGHADAWDGLADEAGRPFCSARWQLAWWTHARPPGARLATVLVRDGDRLVGLAPGYTERSATGVRVWRSLGAGVCQQVEPFAAPGHEEESARAIAAALAAARPGPSCLLLEGVRAGSPWPGLLAAAVPGGRRGRAVVLGRIGSLALETGGLDYDSWFMTKSSHFRQRLRRQRRKADERGGTFRLAGPDDAAADIETFLHVHGGRWEDRGGSRAVTAAVEAMLRDAGPRLVADGRLRVWTLEVDGRPAASSLVFVAGAEAGYWLNGFDAAYADLEPSKISILHVIEDAFTVGARRLDLGEGAFAYKQRFADVEEDLVRVAVLPAGRRRPAAAVALAPALARREVARRLTVEQRTRIKQLIRR